MSPEKSQLDLAAERLCDVAEEVLNRAQENVWELDWESLDPREFPESRW